MKKIIASLFAVFILTFLFATAINAQTGDSKKSGETRKSDQQNKRLKIKSKPRPRLGDCSQDYGVVTIRATFDKSAKVTKAEIYQSSGCDNFDRIAARETMRIKFEPEIKDGEPVTVIKPIQYSFRKY